jgi:hypothetical protein
MGKVMNDYQLKKLESILKITKDEEHREAVKKKIAILKGNKTVLK